MGTETLYMKIIHWLWIKLTNQMVKVGYGNPWMKACLEEAFSKNKTKIK